MTISEYELFDVTTSPSRPLCEFCGDKLAAFNGRWCSAVCFEAGQHGWRLVRPEVEPADASPIDGTTPEHVATVEVRIIIRSE